MERMGEAYKEAYEWWIVSPWLYRQLDKSNEIVLDLDSFNWKLWGRQTTGQAIYLDYVMRDIFG